MKTHNLASGLLGLAAVTLVTVTLATPAALGGSHLWVFDEVFTNTDGSVQFIEMRESKGAPSEIFLMGKWVVSTAVGVQYVFPNNLTPPTSNRHLLLATQSFADLPGAPAPDFIIPQGLFSPSELQTLEYWLYPADWTIPAGAIPTDGVNSLSHSGMVGQNRPENFDGVQGTVVAPCHSADIDVSGQVDVSDLLAVILGWGNGAGDPADVNGDGAVNVTDLLAVILAWGVCGG